MKAKFLLPYLLCGGLAGTSCQPESSYAVDPALIEKIDSVAYTFKQHADSYAGHSYDRSRSFAPPRFDLAHYWKSFPKLIQTLGDEFKQQGYDFGFVKDQDLTRRLDHEMYNARLTVFCAMRDTVTGNAILVSATHNTPYGYKIDIMPLLMDSKPINIDPSLVNATIKAAGLLTAQNDSARAAHTTYPLGETKPAAYEADSLAYENAKTVLEENMIAAFKDQGIDLYVRIDSDRKTSHKIEVATATQDQRTGQSLEIKTIQDLVHFKTLTTVTPH